MLRIIGALGGQFLSGVVGRGGCEGTPALFRVELCFAQAGAFLVQEFSGRIGAIAGLLKVLRDQNEVGPRGADGFLVIGEHAGLKRLVAAEDCGAGRIAEGCGAVGVGKGDTTLGEAVDVWRLDLRMAAQRPDPVVEVVDGDEEDVGPRAHRNVGSENSQGETRQDGGDGQWAAERAMHGKWDDTPDAEPVGVRVPRTVGSDCEKETEFPQHRPSRARLSCLQVSVN